MPHRVLCIGLIGLASMGVSMERASADEAAVAVAANFLSALRALETSFEAASQHEISIISGSTGQLYAQIINGAPFDVFLAADEERPRRLADTHWGEPSSQFTYAIGQLALWSRQADLIEKATLARLPELKFRWLAIAEPAVAPYGAAAKQTLERLGVWRSLEPRIVKGQSVAQTFALTETGNAELGLIALSQALTYQGAASYLVIPEDLHDPIRQDAILLSRAHGNDAAREFLEFLRTPAGAAIIERYGYLSGRSAP
jgi:molybdate transport system substrate-binding protein